MLEVERQKIEYSAGRCSSLKSREFQDLSTCGAGRKKKLLSYKLAATHFGFDLSPHKKCEMKFFTRQNWSGCTWEKNQPQSAATGWRKRMLMTPLLIEGVEASSFAAAGDRLVVHHNSSLSTACPGVLQAKPKSSEALVEEFEHLARDWWVIPLPETSESGERTSAVVFFFKCKSSDRSNGLNQRD